MVRRILLPLDTTALSDAVFRAGLAVARDADASVFIVFVAAPPRWSVTAAALDERQVVGTGDRGLTFQSLERMLHHRVADAARQRVFADGAVVVAVDCAQAIIDVAVAHRCDLIFMGSHHRRGLSRWRKPSITARVVDASPVPVMAYQASAEEVFRAANLPCVDAPPALIGALSAGEPMIVPAALGH